jgi:hypothetical protein
MMTPERCSSMAGNSARSRRTAASRFTSSACSAPVGRHESHRRGMIATQLTREANLKSVHIEHRRDMRRR